MLIDLQTHSWLSRGCNMDPKAVLARAETHGLDGVAFTETNTQDGCDELFALARTSKVKIFVGLELSTDKGQYLCFFADPMKAPEPVQMWGSNREHPWKADECLPKLKSLGAVIVAARPFDRDFSHPAQDHLRNVKGLAAVQVYNPKVRMGANEQAVEMARSLKLPGVAGSDARTLDELGFAATLFKKPVNTQKDLLAALEGGEYWPVMMGDIPRLRRPGEAKAEEAKSRKKKRRRWN